MSIGPYTIALLIVLCVCVTAFKMLKMYLRYKQGLTIR